MILISFSFSFLSSFFFFFFFWVVSLPDGGFGNGIKGLDTGKLSMVVLIYVYTHHCIQDINTHSYNHILLVNIFRYTFDLFLFLFYFHFNFNFFCTNSEYLIIF